MKYQPIKTKSAGIAVIITLIIGFTTLLVSTITPIFPFIFQILSIAIFTVAIQILQRYYLSDFTYIIDDQDNGECIINVVRKQGNKITTVCSINSSNCIYCGTPSGFAEKTVNSFDYRQNIFIPNSFIIIYKDRTGYITIKLEADENFAEQIKSRITNENEKN